MLKIYVSHKSFYFTEKYGKDKKKLNITSDKIDTGRSATIMLLSFNLTEYSAFLCDPV
jgi:hypothetical protein